MVCEKGIVSESIHYVGEYPFDVKEMRDAAKSCGANCSAVDENDDLPTSANHKKTAKEVFMTVEEWIWILSFAAVILMVIFGPFNPRA